jgi:hypothetical protein
MRSKVLTVLAAALLWLGVTGAAAYDTGPHADLTRDALMAEGFSPSAADVGMVNNWFVDYYTNPGKNPYSGHASWTIGLTRLGLPRESWPAYQVEAAQRMHFDSGRLSLPMADLSRTAGVEQEWDRLMFLTRKWAQSVGRRNDPYLLMSVIGISLHSVQDFYTHSNWVEDPHAEPGRGGPGIASLGHGDHPTWFDIPPEVRATLVGDRAVYTGVVGVPRGHSHWREDLNRSLYNGLNKDWPGRPRYTESYITSYFATRQWIRAVRTWLGNEPLWRRAMALPPTAALRRDVEGATEISRHSGHWQGGGEPCLRYFGGCGERNGKAGSLASLKLAIDEFHLGGPSRYRRAFNTMIGAYRDYPDPPPVMPDLPSTRTDQLLTRFVRLEILNYAGIDLGDPVGQADIYANARIRGQGYTSAIINDADSFSFPRARLVPTPFGEALFGGYHAFTWIRSVPAPHAQSMPVTSMTVRIETGNRRGAGTDDDVYLRINGRQRFSLGKRAYDDFERDDDDTYSVPIGDATRAGLTVRDIDRVVIEKSRDGVAGAWLLKGVTLVVNGRAVVRERSINRWLKNKRRTWTAPRLVRDRRAGDVVPIWLQLREDDFGPQDDGDVNRYDRVGTQALAYRPGPPVTGRLRGGSLLRGRLPMGNGDRARLTYRLSTLATVAPPLPAPAEPPVTTPPPLPPDPAPPPPGPPAARPDLVITALDTRTVTVMNTGTAAAGAFNVTVVGWGVVRVPGLAAGASETVTFYTGTNCGGDYRAFADSQNEVAEDDELNNTRELLGVIC